MDQDQVTVTVTVDNIYLLRYSAHAPFSLDLADLGVLRALSVLIISITGSSLRAVASLANAINELLSSSSVR